jgi:hypothetical protein
VSWPTGAIEVRRSCHRTPGADNTGSYDIFGQTNLESDMTLRQLEMMRDSIRHRTTVDAAEQPGLSQSGDQHRDQEQATIELVDDFLK